jgi:DNA mismatch repair protein MutS
MSAGTRPMYQKYYSAWKEYRDKYGEKTVLLYQVGGFFELYDTENRTTGTSQANIREIAELCQLSLTVHPIEHTDTQTLFGGFPEYSLEKFEKILVLANYTVVVMIQKKGKTGAVEERIVDHVSSPGCYVDTSRDRMLVGCVLESMSHSPTRHKVYWAVSALDVATGLVCFLEGTEQDRLHQFLCTYPPSEFLLWSDGLPAAESWYSSLSSFCPTTHVRCLPPTSAALEEHALEAFWPNVSKRLDWVSRQPQARRCLAYLMNFAAEHTPSSLRNIDLPLAWIPDQEVRLGNAALEQLGMISLRPDTPCLFRFMNRCLSVGGRRLMRNRLLRPIFDIPVLQQRLDWADEMRKGSDTEQGPVLRRHLRSLYDTTRLFRRIELGTASVADVSCLLRSYEAGQSLLHLLKHTRCASPRADTMNTFLSWIFSEWNTEILATMAHDGVSIPGIVLPWTAGTFPELETEFEKGVTMYQQAKTLCSTWSALGRKEPLTLDFAEGGGFRITGTKRRISSVLACLRDEGNTTVAVTTYKNTASLESDVLSSLSLRHKTWWEEWVPRWKACWISACQTIVSRGKEVHRALEQWCAEIDVAWTTAQIAAEWLWKRPEFVSAEESFISIQSMRHPILERLPLKVPYVPHTLILGKTETTTEEEKEKETEKDVVGSSECGLLLYGMNASGKSSLMKAIGLCVLLAQSGFPVPAISCRMAPFTSLFTRILNNDNLWAGLSSFAVEMLEFREILRYADAQSLVLGDELCSGTESLSATALVAAGVERLVQQRAKFVFATHLHDLVTLPDLKQVKGVVPVHLQVHYDIASDLLVYDRNLMKGSGSSLYGLEVCRALNLPSGYLERATTLRNILSGEQVPHLSSYSSNAVVDVCHICGSSSSLEIHHIRPQKEEQQAKEEGVSLHSSGNLVCLCAKCHDAYHAGRIHITGWQEIEGGRRLVWRDTTHRDTKTKSKETPEDLSSDVIRWVREQRRQNIRVATIQRIAKQIFSIPLSVTQIRSV